MNPIRVRLLVGVVGLLTSFSLPGCRPSIPFVRSERLFLPEGTVTTIIMAPGRKLSVREFVGLAKVGRVYSYEAIWDPGPGVESALIRGLADRFCFKVQPVALVLGQAESDRFRSDQERAFLERIRFEPAQSVLRHSKREELQALRTMGTEYVLEVWMTLSMIGTSMSSPWLHLHAYGRLRRTEDGAVLWAAVGSGTASIPGLQDMVEGAKDDCELLKKALAAAAENLFDTENRGGFFHGFLPE